MIDKIVGREVAVARAHYGTFEEGGKKKSGYIFKEQMICDPVTLEIFGITLEAMLNCVGQLEDMGSYEEISKAQGYDQGGYKPTGLVVISKSDPRVKCSVEFGHRWNKDSDAQSLTPQSEEKAVTLKWFVDVENLDREMGQGAVPERAVTPEELDVISKIREQTKETKIESVYRSYQPVLDAVKSHKGKPQKLQESGYEDAGQEGGMDYERDVVTPSWKKWTLRGGPPKFLGSIRLEDEEGGEQYIQVYQSRHADHMNLPGIHLTDPDQADIDDAIETASRDGFAEMIIHGDIPPGLKLEALQGVIMKEKRTFGMDCEDVDFFGLPKLQEAESTYAPTFKPAKAPLVSKDPQAYNKVVDKLDGSNKMRDKDEKPPVMGEKPLAKPASTVGKEYGEKDFDQSKVKVGDPGDDQGDSMAGSGKSDTQQKVLPAAKVKLGKPGDDQGKHMTDSVSTSGRKKPGVFSEHAMLRRRMPETRGAASQKQELSKMESQSKKRAMMKQSAYEARKKK